MEESFGLVQAFAIAGSIISLMLAVISTLIIIIYKGVRSDIERSKRDQAEDRKELGRVRDLLANEYARMHNVELLSARVDSGFSEMTRGFERIFDKLDGKVDKAGFSA